jgi:chemotaxis protein CheZ
MAEDSKVPRRIHEELGELTKSIDEMIKAFRRLQNPIEESRQRVPMATMQLERINQQTEEATHKVLDMVEEITKDAGNIVQDLKTLRRALPATYFRNRSGIRDTFERIEQTANKSQDNAFAIMDALQFQDITAQQMEHTAHLLDEVETKLHSVRGLFGDDTSEEEIVRKKRAFDPNARYTTSSDSQQEVDELVESVKAAKTE